MANRERGEVEIQAGGQTYTLVCDLDALCQLEELFSTPEKPVYYPEIIQRLMQGSMRDIRAFLWAALRRYHPEMKLQGDIARFLSEAGGLTAIDAQLKQLTSAAQPDDEDLETLKSRPPSAQLVGKRGEDSISKPVGLA